MDKIDKMDKIMDVVFALVYSFVLYVAIGKGSACVATMCAVLIVAALYSFFNNK